jgi:predicted dienelactone hydrolase
LRAATLYRIARFPYIYEKSHLSPPNSAKWAAWKAQKEVYMKAASTWPEPVVEHNIPFTGKTENEGETIPIYVRMPECAVAGPVPAVILMTGLDGYRPDNTERTQEFISRGWAAVVVEIPGTADSPADAADAESPDRLWTALLEWMRKTGDFDMDSILVWGLSSGGYYAIRIAHTHAKEVKGSIAQGAGSHWFFHRAWLDKADGHEYPFA